MKSNFQKKHIEHIGVFFAAVSFVVFFYMKNTTLAFDDFNFLAIFPALILKYGYLKTAWVLLSGMDMPAEYRTYGFSRLLQYSVWLMAGKESWPFSLIIALSQVFSAVAVLSLMKFRHIDQDISLAVAIIWLISPFLMNWSFHHYSYLVLPFQLVILSCWLIDRISPYPSYYVVAVLLGMVTALTGEMFLISGPLAILLWGLTSKDSKRIWLSCLVVASIILMLLIHRFIWTKFFQNVELRQRYELLGTIDWHDIALRTAKAINSIGKSFYLQLDEAFLSGKNIGIAIGLVFGWGVLQNKYLHTASSENPSDTKNSAREIYLTLAFLALGIASSTIFLVVSVMSNQIYEVMPRRYGYVSLTLMLLAAITGVASIFKYLGVGKKIVLAIAVGAVAAQATQLNGVTIKKTRSSDKNIISSIKVLGDAENDKSVSAKGVLFYVASNPDYQQGNANGGTPGVAMGTQISAELLESPFSTYWTSASYAVNFLGYKFAGIPKAKSEEGMLLLGGEGGLPSANHAEKTDVNSVIVIANLGMESDDRFAKNTRIFKSFSDFEPYFFGRRIDRNFWQPRKILDEIIIDFGKLSSASFDFRTEFPDKKYLDTDRVINSSWLKNYGLLDGQDSIYENPDFSNAFSYLKTNRNGYFSYGFSFENSVDTVEVSLDFFEQWRSGDGQRVFELEVSWDDLEWVSLGKIDIFELNKNEPVSIVLTKRGAKSFKFRTKLCAESMDVPVIQGVRIRKGAIQ